MSHPALALARRALLLGAVSVAGIFALDACADSPSAVGPDVRAAKGGNGGKPGSAETILFAGTTGVNSDIYAMNPDGSNVRRLTTDTASEFYPDFAPDNRKFVFVRTGADASHSELWTATADGGRQTQLTSIGSYVMQPRYSPDGSKIAFTASVPGYGQEIFTINADGSGLYRLTYNDSDDRSPTWSADGSEIAFQSNRGGLPYIYVMTSGGLNVRTLMECFNLGCGEPAFSPDGKKIAVTDIANGNVFVLLIEQQLSLGVGSSVPGRSSLHPAWTKDGTQVVFSSDRGIEGRQELYVGTPGDFDLTHIKRLTIFSPGDAQTPSYSH